MARLFTKGKDYGPHAFVVQVRQGLPATAVLLVVCTPDAHMMRVSGRPLCSCLSDAWSCGQLPATVHGCHRPCHPPPPQIRDLDTHLPLPGIMVGDIGPKMGCVPSTRAVCAWNSVLLLLLAPAPRSCSSCPANCLHCTHSSHT